MIPRHEYLDSLVRLRDTPRIKIITGIRRCGKTALLDQYVDYLRADGISEERILYFDLADGDYSEIETGGQLCDYLDDKAPPDKTVYILLEGTERLDGFEKAVDRLLAKKNRDVYITSSGAALSASLAGCCAEIQVFPLSFREYVSACPEDAAGADIGCLFADYTRYGAFPCLSRLSASRDKRRYVRDVFDFIVLKEIVAKKKFPDVAMFQSVARFMCENTGYICTTKSVADIMTKTGKKISVHTAESYLSALTDSFILRKIGRYDLKEKRCLKTGCKYYAADTGLWHALAGSKKTGEGEILENVVYLELLRRGYDIHIGKIGNTEVDFVVSGGGGVEYYQVAGGTSLKRELAPLEAIKDNNPKYLLTPDRVLPVSHNGIIQVNVLDWLLRREKIPSL